MTRNHGADEYVGYQGAPVNGLKSFWSALKRVIKGAQDNPTTSASTNTSCP